MMIAIENSILRVKRYSNESFVGTSFDDSILYECSFRSSRFEGGNLMYLKLIKCDFNDTLFYWAYQLNNVFVSCNFEDVKFAGVRFEDTTFIDCVFTRVLFRPSNLGGGCDLTTASFINCEFSECQSINSEVSSEYPLPEGIRIYNLDSKNIDLV